MPQAWHWAQENSTVIGVVLSLVSTLISIAGFVILWVQTKKARDAAEAAKEATQAAIQAISDTDTVSDLARVNSGLKGMQVALHGDRYETALLQAQELRERLHQLRVRRGFESEERRTQIQSMVASLRKLQDKLERKIREPEVTFSVPSANQTLADYVTEVSGWMEEVRFLRGRLGS
ncbi:MAG TPA: hypothetical protein VI756_07780 [Blastocatellia bacterium]